MDSSDRCPCGARIVGVSTVETREGQLKVYTCGVCGTQLIPSEPTPEVDRWEDDGGR